ncbi:C40 family peptidase [Nocardia veterana]|uniref:CHAP domain-containing protein n=1 Tax=Nocardia veterana TaxID=132249 RepID=A0A7X6LYH5_9NOCA|nr:CHAP domain-containing protein [Nocardia veterana]NKY86414.1 CHAP domain-containing protein [Nocardia veterana]
MSPTDHYWVVPKLEDLLPSYASPTLKAIVATTRSAIQANVDNLGAGTPSRAPKYIKMLRDNNLIDENNRATSTEDHNAVVRSLTEMKTTLDNNDKGVDSSTFGTYSAAGSANEDIQDAVERLRNTISDTARANGPSVNRDTGEQFWPESVEGPLRTACATAAADVEDAIETATTDIRRHADHITGSRPDNPTPVGYGGTAVPLTTPWSGHNYVPPPNADTLQKIEGFARNELGVTEGPNNHVDRPYNIDDAWCSSFATWVWKQAGIDVPWTNKNLVSAVWSDAVARRLADNIADARPGDLVVFGGQNHIGVIVARNGNTITTIEGNSGDAVRQHTYDLSRSNFTGVVHPPADARVPVTA